MEVLYYKEDEHTEDCINLYELEEELGWEVIFFEGVMDSIKFKASCLPSDVAALKIELQLLS